MNQLGSIVLGCCASCPFHSGRLDLNWRCDSSIRGGATFWGLFFRVVLRMVWLAMQSDLLLCTLLFQKYCNSSNYFVYVIGVNNSYALLVLVFMF